MIRRILLTTVAVASVFAAWHWLLPERENDSVRTLAVRESTTDCLQGDVRVTARLLNLRALPVNGKVVGRFGEGTRLKASRCAASWAKIAASGWVHADYLRPVPDNSPSYMGNHGAMASNNLPPPRAAGESNCGTGYRQVSAGRLNLRSAPVDGAVTGQIAVGSGVTVSRCDGDWAQVSIAGWVHTNYLASTAEPPHPRP